MKEIARAYIRKRIRQARNDESDFDTDATARATKKTRSELAEKEAQKGLPANTASHLRYVDNWPLSKKAEVLANAYTRSAENSTWSAERSIKPNIKGIHQEVARGSNKIAQGLRRAAQRS